VTLNPSATGTPASSSFKIPMICSSEKRLRFMLWSSLGPERTSNWIKPEGQGQRQSDDRRERTLIFRFWDPARSSGFRQQRLKAATSLALAE
jgi:hypothetical protein